MEENNFATSGSSRQQDYQNGSHQQHPPNNPAADPNAATGYVHETNPGQVQQPYTSPGTPDMDGQQATMDFIGQGAFVHAQVAGYVVDPVTGQLFYKIPVQNGPGPMNTGMSSPHVAVANPAGNPPGQEQTVSPPPGPDYGQIIKSVEQFAEGDATVGEVIKILYANTAQDDQFWKGAVVGAAAAVLLTSGPVAESLGKTFGSLFGRSGPNGNGTDQTDSSQDTKKKE